MPTRISIRLDHITQAKLERIQAQTRQSVTELIAEALDLYDRKLRSESLAGNRELLSLAGIISAPPPLSGCAKDEVAAALDHKLSGHR